MKLNLVCVIVHITMIVVYNAAIWLDFVFGNRSLNAWLNNPGDLDQIGNIIRIVVDPLV